MKLIRLVTRSLRLIGVVDAAEAPEAEDYVTALEALNAMMRRWEANGIALGWNDVDVNTEDVPAPPEALEAIIFNLAMTLGAEYGVEIRPDVAAVAARGQNELRRDVLAANPLVIERSGWRYNIYSDSYE